jgi:hypothetical protein
MLGGTADTCQKHACGMSRSISRMSGLRWSWDKFHSTVSKGFASEENPQGRSFSE